MRWILALAMACVTGCSSGGSRGHLVIAGGAVKADNARLYGEFFRSLAPDAVIGVVPTASASAAESAESSAKTLTRHASGRRIIKLDLPSAQPQNAMDPAIVEQIRGCSALWFTGGVQSRILAVFRPANGDSPSFDAARAVLDRGGVIGGTSAGAAMMSDPMITGGSSEDALAGNFRTEDEDSGLGIGKGMGFFPYGLVDQHFLHRGRIGRLIVALERTGLARGYGVEENSAIAVDLASAGITALGPVAIVDISKMSVLNAARLGIRVSLLHDGDTVDGRSGSASPLGHRVWAVAAADGGAPLPAAWSSGALEAALLRLASSPTTAVALESPGFVLKLASDASTTFWDHNGRISVLNAVLDVSPRASP